MISAAIPNPPIQSAPFSARHGFPGRASFLESVFNGLHGCTSLGGVNWAGRLIIWLIIGLGDFILTYSRLP